MYLFNNLKKRIVIQKEDSNLSKEEIEARLEELKELKISPKDREENKLILSRGERLYEESVGEIREKIDIYIRHFENVLDKQDKIEITKAAKELKAFFDEIESIDLL